MGCEFAQGDEWHHDRELDLYVLDYPLHQGIKRLVQDLNQLYHTESALHLYGFDKQGFEWIDCNDSDNSVLVYARHGDNNSIIAVCNFTPVPRLGYRIGVLQPGHYAELLNSDAAIYGGSDVGVTSSEIEFMQRQHSIELSLPPLAVLVLKLQH